MNDSEMIAVMANPSVEQAARDRHPSAGSAAARMFTKCELCGQPRKWHVEHKPKHQFIEPNEQVALVLAEDLDLSGSPEPETPGEGTQAPSTGTGRLIDLPGDPLLRAVLIRAGIITQEQLQQEIEAYRTLGYILVGKETISHRASSTDDK